MDIISQNKYNGCWGHILSYIYAHKTPAKSLRLASITPPPPPPHNSLGEIYATAALVIISRIIHIPKLSTICLQSKRNGRLLRVVCLLVFSSLPVAGTGTFAVPACRLCITMTYFRLYSFLFPHSVFHSVRFPLRDPNIRSFVYIYSLVYCK